ncbi:hypothetical protein PCYB_004880, partial [Plasmodium cynomolgi strain B]
YPFLNNFISAYREFDEQLEEYDNPSSFDVTKLINIQEREQNYKDIFKKLIRNLQKFQSNRSKVSQEHEYCTYLYHWLYLNTKKYMNFNIDIRNFFYIFQDVGIPIKINICPYESYYRKTAILISNDLAKLSYFKYNYENIKNILNKEKNHNYCLCQNYFKECVNTYNYMYDSSCSSVLFDNLNEELCSELREFKNKYSDLTSEPTLAKKIPNIDIGESKLELINCQAEEISELISHTDASSDAAASQHVSDVKTLPTALGTIAGATSILALLYKVNTIFYLKICKILHTYDYAMLSY